MMKRLFLLSSVLAVLGWAAWYYGPVYERSRVSQKQQAATAAVSPGGGDSFLIAEEESVGGGWELLGIGMCVAALCITTAAAIVWLKDKSGET